MESKAFYTSKTLWVNAIAAVAFFAQSQWGFVLPVELQAQLLVIANVVLRCITTKELI